MRIYQIRYLLFVNKGFYFLFVLILTFLLGFGTRYFTSRVTRVEVSELQPCQYELINPLRCDPSQVKPKRELSLFKETLIEYIEEQKKSQNVSDVSFYFRDLDSGPTIFFKEQEEFYPASLMKLPVMITYLKRAQEDNSILATKFNSGDIQPSVNQNFQSGKSLEPNRQYSVEELLTTMIVYSDNDSAMLLLKNLWEEDAAISTLSDLGIIDPTKSKDEYLTVKQYASLFRIIYNASYLNLEMSEKALDILSRSEFKAGLRRKLPENTRIAHKYGEHEAGGMSQLHDCGIVYHPKTNYVLCVMTSGKNFGTNAGVIAEISKRVYDEVATF